MQAQAQRTEKKRLLVNGTHVIRKAQVHLGLLVLGYASILINLSTKIKGLILLLRKVLGYFSSSFVNDKKDLL
jgi:hypothetical protein